MEMLMNRFLLNEAFQQEDPQGGPGQKIEDMQIFDVLYDDDIWDSEAPEAPQKNK